MADIFSGQKVSLFNSAVMIKKILLFSFLQLLFCFTIMAQQPGAGQMPQSGGGKFKMPSIGHIYGKIVDAKTKEVVPFASVALFKKDSVIAGSFTKINGDFSMENLPYGKFSFRVTFIGYKTLQQVVTITPQNEEQDLGDIKLETEETMLKAVEITEEKSAVEMNIDRKVFNVDKNIVSKGGTAADVMSNIPSVTVDENGNAQLRQNAATIYVDGRPTTLTLDQIPADQIDRVEVITNPSAKYEASATGGIINIVMKSNSKPGYNGMVTGGAGTNNHYNGLVTLNIKQKPIGLSVTYNFNTFQNPVTGYNYRTDIPSGYFNSSDNINFHHTFQSGAASFDYYINNRNTLTLSENMAIGDFNSYDTQSYNSADVGNVNLMNGSRITNSLTHFENYTTKLSYRKTFPEKGKELTADMNYNTTTAKNPSDYTTYVNDANGNPLSQPAIQNNNAVSQSQMYTFQADYVNPINDSTKIETGVRSSYKPSNQYLDVTNYDYSSDVYTSNQALTSYYKIQDLVNAAYVNYTTRYKKIDYSLGLRFEDSYYKGILTNKNDSSFQYSYPNKLNNIMNALFPSLFISKKLNQNQEIQFNASRKINRPNFRQLMPFIQASDAKDYTIGNPSLTPEFINMAELNFNQNLSRGNLLFGLFYRNNQNPLTQYTSPLPSDPSILVTTTINAKQSNSVGMDNTFKYTWFRSFETTLNMNLFYTVIDATYNNANIGNQGFNYTGKLNLLYRMPKSFSMQLSGNYESRKTIPQGYNKEVYFADFALNKDVHKFITITLSVRDIFNTKGRGSYLTTDEYIQDTWNRRESRFVKLIVSMRFGKADASVFKRKKQQQSDTGDNLDF